MAKKKAKKKSRRRVLPHKMSALITLGLKDLRKVEANDKYLIDMGYWHDVVNLTCKIEGTDEVIEEHQKCAVCFAGAVMAGTLKGSPDKDLKMSDFGVENQRQLSALDSLRAGSAQGAANELGIIPENTLSWNNPRYSEMEKKRNAKFAEFEKLEANIPEYDRDNPEPFHRAMTKFRDKLAKAGY